jgi:hypothetical protein
VVFVDAQRIADGVEFVDEQLWCPEVRGGVGQVGAVPASDLVVVDDRATGLRSQSGNVAHVVVRHSRAAVQDEQGEGATARIVRRR